MVHPITVTVTITTVAAGGEVAVQDIILGPVPEAHITQADVDQGLEAPTTMTGGGPVAGAGEVETESPTVARGVGQGHMIDKEALHKKDQGPTADQRHP